MWKRTAALIVSLLITAVFIGIAVREIPLDEVWEDMRRANIPLLILAVAIGVVGIYTRGIRWKGLVDHKIDQNTAFYIVGIMMVLNLFLRLGEVARTILARRENVPVVTAATSIVVERLLDTLTVLIVLGIVVLRIPMTEETQQYVFAIAPTFIIITIVGFATMIVLARYPQVAHNILNAITKRFTFLQRFPLDELLDHLLIGLKPLVEWRSAAHAIGWTVISWILSYALFVIVQLALNVPENVFAQSGLGLSLAAFGVALPTIGAIGPFETAMIFAGVAFGLSYTTALAIGVVNHMATILVYAITGIWGFIAMGVQLGDVMQSGEKPAEIGQEVA